MSRCEHCPVAPGVRCFGEAAKLCRLAHRPDYRQLIVEKTLAGEADLLPPSRPRPAYPYGYHPAPRPSASTPPVKVPPGTLLVQGIGDNSTGYGQMTAHLCRQIAAAGVPIAFSANNLDEARIAIDPLIKASLVSGPIDSPCLCMNGPLHPAPDGSAHLTMWEAFPVPERFTKNLNRARVVIVPCEDNRRWFVEGGATVPIRVVPLGIDPKVYRVTTPEPRGVFRVGCAGRVGPAGGRKGFPDVIAAFLKAFPDDPDCFLEIKCYRDCHVSRPTDPRIRLVQDALTDEGLADWYRSLNLFVSASRGEGWGLCPHQAMACGRPVAAPLWGGHKEYMDRATSYPVDYTEGDDGTEHYDGFENWCLPDVDSLAAQMRRARDNPEERQAKGRLSAEVAAKFTWERSGRELLAVLREFELIPKVRPAVVEDLRLIKLRKACPHGRKASACGCSDELICALGKGGRTEQGLSLAGRSDCYRCLQTA